MLLVKLDIICHRENVYNVMRIARHVILRDAKLASLDRSPILKIMFYSVTPAR